MLFVNQPLVLDISVLWCILQGSFGRTLAEEIAVFLKVSVTELVLDHVRSYVIIFLTRFAFCTPILDSHVRASVRDDPLFLRNVIGYSEHMLGGPSMWGSKGMLIVMAEKAAITRETQIYVPSHPAHATICR
jgi:hypothetical protein